jgi:hypothetical protein
MCHQFDVLCPCIGSTQTIVGLAVRARPLIGRFLVQTWMSDDERLDLVGPYHFEELTDSAAYAYAVFERSREPRPTFSGSEED